MNLIAEMKKQLQELEKQDTEVSQQMSALAEKKQEIYKAMNGIKAWLSFSGENLQDSKDNLSLRDMLMAVMVPEKSYTLGELVNQIKKHGFDFGDKSPNKSVNFTLMGISRGDRVSRTADGRWLRKK